MRDYTYYDKNAKKKTSGKKQEKKFYSIFLLVNFSRDTKTTKINIPNIEKTIKKNVENNEKLLLHCLLCFDIPRKIQKKKEIFKPGIIFKKINDLGIFYIIRKSILEKQKTKKTSTTVPTLIKSYLKILSSACGKFFLSCDTI